MRLCNMWVFIVAMAVIPRQNTKRRPRDLDGAALTTLLVVVFKAENPWLFLFRMLVAALCALIRLMPHTFPKLFATAGSGFADKGTSDDPTSRDALDPPPFLAPFPTDRYASCCFASILWGQ